MSAPAFERAGTGVLEALLGGASIPEAARAHEVAPRTVDGWLEKGRRDPGGTFGAFARAVDVAREARRLPSAPERDELAEEELRALVARAARGGNVAAMKLYHDLYLRAAEASVEPADDPLAEVDELARRRTARVSVG